MCRLFVIFLWCQEAVQWRTYESFTAVRKWFHKILVWERSVTLSDAHAVNGVVMVEWNGQQTTTKIQPVVKFFWSSQRFLLWQPTLMDKRHNTSMTKRSHSRLSSFHDCLHWRFALFELCFHKALRYELGNQLHLQRASYPWPLCVFLLNTAGQGRFFQLSFFTLILLK